MAGDLPEEVALSLEIAAESTQTLALDRERPLVTAAAARIRAHVLHMLEQQRVHLATVARGARPARKAAGGAGDDDPVAEAARNLDYEPLGSAVRPEIEAVAKDAARLGMQQVGASELEALLSQSNALAVDWAAERAGELVRQVGKTTRQAVADLTSRAMDEGWTNDALADALDSSDAFGESRAETIARTETAISDVRGNLIGWRESGVVTGKEWVVADAAECDDCADMAGEVVDLDDDFPDGDPPLHPNCRCDVLPVIRED